jgi:hypothetical protein
MGPFIMNSLLQRIYKGGPFQDRRKNPSAVFHSHHYLRHNARRQEHLASLRIPVAGATVLEVGAGIGDHSHYFLDRKCGLTITECREENLKLLRERYPSTSICHLDLDDPVPLENAPFDVVYCYGLLYHLRRPEEALQYLARSTADILLLETCVSFGDGAAVMPTPEDAANPSQAAGGTGCRPTRPWVRKELKRHFEFVYVPHSQPNHEEFPIDWACPDRHAAQLARSVFIASRRSLDNPELTDDLPTRQVRHP